jgi:hypothetical protein
MNLDNFGIFDKFDILDKFDIFDRFDFYQVRQDRTWSRSYKSPSPTRFRILVFLHPILKIIF